MHEVPGGLRVPGVTGNSGLPGSTRTPCSWGHPELRVPGSQPEESLFPELPGGLRFLAGTRNSEIPVSPRTPCSPTHTGFFRFPGFTRISPGSRFHPKLQVTVVTRYSGFPCLPEIRVPRVTHNPFFVSRP